jgi:nitrate reductase gamma subunit
VRSAELIVGAILPYVAVVAFLGGVVHRFSAWSGTPQPGRMTLFPTAGWGLVAALKEALLFPSLFRDDRSLWLVAWSFHVALALAFLGHFRAVTGLIDVALAGVGIGSAGIDTISAVAGGAAGVVLLAAGVALLLRRFLVGRVREISGGADYLALALLIAVIASGNLLRFGGWHVDLAETRVWALSLLTFTPVVPSNPAFLVHLFCAEVVLVYVATSKLLHFGGFFFSLPLVRRT